MIYLCFPLAILGFIDDKYLIPSKVRYVFQLITGVLLIIFSPNFYQIQPGDTIVVPKEILTISGIPLVESATNILSSLSISAASLNALRD